MQLPENSLCPACKHLDINTETLAFECAAFPEGIPEEILSGEFIHTKKHPKQNNEILFEEKEEK